MLRGKQNLTQNIQLRQVILSLIMVRFIKLVHQMIMGGILEGFRLSNDVIGGTIYMTVNDGTDKEIKKEVTVTHSYESYMRIKRVKGEQ